jgi:sugar phosphate isomerase/epimerase
VDTSSIALATACLPNRSLAEAMATARRLGFTAIGLLGAAGSGHSGGSLAGFFWDDLSPEERADLRTWRAWFRRGAIHAPFQELPLISVNRYVELEAARQVRMAVRAAGELGLELVTVHCVPPGRLQKDTFWGRLVPLLRALGDEAARLGTRIGVENVQFPATPDEHVELLERVDHPYVGATLDLGHIKFWFERDGITSLPEDEARDRYNERLLALLDRLGERVFHIHAHDVRAADIRDHRGVGRGIVDLDAVLGRLLALGYDGLLELELEEPDDEQAAVESRDRLAAALERCTVGQPA